MIEQSFSLPWPPDAWRAAIRTAVRDTQELIDILGLDASELDYDMDPSFPLFIPHGYIRRMNRHDPYDPLLLQVLPRKVESHSHPQYLEDPLAERAATVVPGMIKKYPNRVLLIAATTCAVNCRFCFRRHFPYEEHRARSFELALSSIRADVTIEEVILSGGDPLVMTDHQLNNLIKQINEIPHVKRIRIHTRLPVAIPERITHKFISLLKYSRATPVLVFHFNHANEIDDQVGMAMGSLKEQNFTLLNQSVLLSGINDQAELLAELSLRMFEVGILPYYLHLPDKVSGTSHFDPGLRQSMQIFSQLQELLPGYLVPRLVREIPGAVSKEILAANLPPVDLHSSDFSESSRQ